MAMYTIPAETFADLLRNVEGSIFPASPFRFLIDGQEQASLEPHLPWLKQHGYLQGNGKQDGRVALLPDLTRSLEIAARPIRRVTVGEVRPDGTSRAVYVSDGVEVIAAMFDRENCLLSDPVDLDSFYSDLVEAVGVGPAEGRRPLQINPAGLTFFGALVGPMSPDDDADLSGGAGPDELAWPIDRAAAEARLSGVVEDKELAEELLESFLADNILAADKGALAIHEEFRPWHEAITSGHVLQLVRVEFPGGSLEKAHKPAMATFVGPAGERVLIWPAQDGSGEVLLTAPNESELRQVIGYLVGYVEA